MKNLYKRLDVFRCNQESHHAFQGRVSVYHVLREKQCYPQGCLYFLWHCTRFEKGQKCVRQYNFIGKNCKGCTYYLEEKVHLQPECILSQTAFEKFQNEFESFEEWIHEIQFKRTLVTGKIHLIKPWFEQDIQHQTTRSRLRGYLLIFKRGFIGITAFEDTFYVRISESMMRQFRFLPKMRMDMIGEVRVDQGRLIIHRPGRIEIHTKGWGRLWTREKALVALRTATKFNIQPEKCLQCRWGILVDIRNHQEDELQKHRNLLCMQGISNPEGCYVNSARRINRREKGDSI